MMVWCFDCLVGQRGKRTDPFNRCWMCGKFLKMKFMLPSEAEREAGIRNSIGV